MPNQGNRERGLRAALKNPRVSEAAKQRDREILETEFGEHFEAPEAEAEPEFSPEPVVSSPSDMEYAESPPRRVQQTAGVHSSAKASSRMPAGVHSMTGPKSMAKSASMDTSDISQSTEKPASTLGRTAKGRRSSVGASGIGSHGDEIEGKDVGNV